MGALLSRADIGTTIGPCSIEYTWRDVVLYALSIGASVEEELDYVYEKNLKAFPTFGVLPVFAQEDSPVKVLACYQAHPDGYLHMDHEFIQHDSMDPMGGKLIYTPKLVEIYDNGERGAKFITQTDVYDETGRLLFTNLAGTYSRFDGGWGGEPAPRSDVSIPERDPDFIETVTLSPQQGALYRLTGDHLGIHIDPDIAARRGFRKPILHGLCTYGFACRIAVKHLFPGEPERFRRMKAKFSKPVYPGSTLAFQFWTDSQEKGKAYFRVVDTDTQAAVLDKGIIEWN